jgi:predicted enzyme related to lactoylglutathione lyase
MNEHPVRRHEDADRSAFRVIVLAVALALFAAGCAQPKLPPVATTGQYLPGKVVWHDLVTADLAAAQKFYAALFGWSFYPAGDGYLHVFSGGRLIGGMATQPEPPHAGYWMPLVSVSNVDRAVEAVSKSGGTRHIEPFDMPGRGRVSVVADPFGATFGLIRTAQGDPADHPAEANDWLWNEIWTTDPARAAGFYKAVAGYTEGEREAFGAAYHYLEASGKPRAGLVAKPDPKLSDTWLVYVRVEDPAAVAKRAEALGGKVLLAPGPQARGGTLAIIMDPAGAAFAVQKWEH